ncbi:MAG: glycogen/starch synthase, partial [Thermodesulfobacteriota bacterium]|nr:glycogen/starch synthase [Thermodesulfobacteriota bacterium]
MSSKIAFVTYETPFAPCGGIAAMIRHLPDQLQKSSGVDTTVITPFHHNIEKTISIEPHLKHKAQIHVPFGREEVAIDILTYNDDKYQCIHPATAGRPAPGHLST